MCPAPVATPVARRHPLEVSAGLHVGEHAVEAGRECVDVGGREAHRRLELEHVAARSVDTQQHGALPHPATDTPDTRRCRDGEPAARGDVLCDPWSNSVIVHNLACDEIFSHK